MSVGHEVPWGGTWSKIGTAVWFVGAFVLAARMPTRRGAAAVLWALFGWVPTAMVVGGTFIWPQWYWPIVSGSLAALWLLSIVVWVQQRPSRYNAPVAPQGPAERPYEAQLDTLEAQVREALAELDSMIAPEPAPAPAPTSLWLPPTQRRVRRGGTTLSGTPIRDRRIVDPRTL